MSTAAAILRRQGHIVHEGLFEEAALDWEAFDVVHSSHVIEHVADPKEFAEKWWFYPLLWILPLVTLTTFANGVYFLEEDIFRFTSKLGVMRLHTQKLGNALKRSYPMLQVRESQDSKEEKDEDDTQE